jgi:hypothetical protein
MPLQGLEAVEAQEEALLAAVTFICETSAQREPLGFRMNSPPTMLVDGVNENGWPSESHIKIGDELVQANCHSRESLLHMEQEAWSKLLREERPLTLTFRRWFAVKDHQKLGMIVRFLGFGSEDSDSIPQVFVRELTEENGWAARNGVQAGDELIAVHMQHVALLEKEEIRKHLKETRPLLLGFKRNGKVRLPEPPPLLSIPGMVRLTLSNAGERSGTCASTLCTTPRQHRKNIRDSLDKIRDKWTRYSDEYNVAIPHGSLSIPGSHEASPEHKEIDHPRMGVHSQGTSRRDLQAIVDKMDHLEDRLLKQVAMEKALQAHHAQRADDRGDTGLGSGTLQRTAARFQDPAEPHPPESATECTTDNFCFQGEMARLHREIAAIPRDRMSQPLFPASMVCQPLPWSPLPRSEWAPPYSRNQAKSTKTNSISTGSTGSSISSVYSSKRCLGGPTLD